MRPVLLWLGLMVALPVGELIAHATIVSKVAPDSDYRAAAAFVRAHLLERDLVTISPAWVDPILRLHLGDRIPLSMVGRSDDSAYERRWVLSLRDAIPSELASRKPELVQRFGRVRVLRYSFGKSPVLFDFTSALPSASASIVQRGHAQACSWRSGGVPRGGGLGHGVLYPLAERFECDAHRPWLFVGAVVMEDLDLKPRHCIWQHAQGDEPVSVTFTNVPLGDELVFYGGLYYEHERMRQGGPVQAEIFIDGQSRARMTHVDGDGWKRLVVASGGQSETARGEVRVEVRAPMPDRRSFCWSATTRQRSGARP